VNVVETGKIEEEKKQMMKKYTKSRMLMRRTRRAKRFRSGKRRG